MLEIIERAITKSIKAWLGIRRNSDAIAKHDREIERLQTQFDEINRRTVNHDLRLDTEERTITHLITSTEVIEAKITRAIANSEHALELVRKNNAARHP